MICNARIFERRFSDQGPASRVSASITLLLVCPLAVVAGDRRLLGTLLICAAHAVIVVMCGIGGMIDGWLRRAYDECVNLHRI